MFITCNIHPSNLDYAVKKLASLQKKATFHGCNFGYKVWEPTYVYITVSETGIQQPMPVIPITVTAEIIRAQGWEVVALIRRNYDRNVVITLSDEVELDRNWYELAPYCEHCNTLRHRNVTFLVYSPVEGLRQVGSSCLEGYAGIDPEGVLAWAEVQHMPTITEDDVMDADEVGSAFEATSYPLQDTLCRAVALCRTEGYKSVNRVNSTKSRLRNVCCRIDVTDADVQTADSIIRWLEDSPDETLNEFELNCKSIIESGAILPRLLGYIAFLPKRFEQVQADMQAKQRAEARSGAVSGEGAQAGYSQWIGEEGDRITLHDCSARQVSSWNTLYGETHLYEFVDEEGNVFVWFSSRWLGEIQDGVRVDVVGTVKKHDVYQGFARTVLTRCKVKMWED